MTDSVRGPRATRRDHGWMDERSRALHAQIAEKLHANPDLIRVARENLERWQALRGSDPAIEEWKRLLESTSIEELVALLTEESEDAARLRQSSPFAGILSPDERMAVLRHYERL